MSANSEKVKAGYTELGSSEQAEIKKFIEEFERKPYLEQKAIKESFNTVRNKSLGPISSNACPCCGK